MLARASRSPAQRQAEGREDAWGRGGARGFKCRRCFWAATCVSPLPAITAAHGAEQAARHACSHPPFSGLTWVFGVGLRTRWKDWGKGSIGSPGIGCPCSYRGVVRSSNRFLSVGPCAVCDLKDKPKRPKP
ncbi:MAG: hypothetical protein ACK55Z_37690 [bacterium]